MTAIATKTGTGSADAVTRAQALLRAGRPDQALSGLLPLLSRQVEDVSALDCAAMCYWRLGDGVTALALMQVVTENWPNLPAAWSKRAAMAASLGDKGLAESCLRKALTLTPGSIPVLAALNRIAPFSRNGAMARRLKSRAQAKGVKTGDRVMALNALGRIEDRAGRYRKAFRLFQASKSAGGATYEPDVTDDRVEAQIARSAPDARAGGPKVVFVTGMPRSGTTLIEAVLARHSQVVSAGESHALSRARAQAVASGWRDGDWSAADVAQAARRAYLGGLGLPPGRDGRVVLDKMPLNLLDLDFAAWILPQARFVFLQRHPLDVGLSCFSTNFFEGNGFSHRLDWIGHLTRAVYRAASDYQVKLGGIFRRQSYRALVEAPEMEIRALLEHVGLPFQVKCLTPEAGQGPTRTASLYQVREAINRKGLGKWQNYARELAPLVDALGADWVRDWEDRDTVMCA